MFTEGSKYLYEATRKRAYFSKVTILVPKTWTPRPEYQLPGNVTFDYADVIVAPANPRWAPLQYTKQYQGCGEQGVHIHFMDEFLLNPITEFFYGPLGEYTRRISVPLGSLPFYNYPYLSSSAVSHLREVGLLDRWGNWDEVTVPPVRDIYVQ